MSDANSRYVLENVNVLVLDDNRHMRQLVESILHALGVKRVQFHSTSALAACHARFKGN